MQLPKSSNKRLIFTTFVSLGAALLFVTKPLFAQTPQPQNPNGQEQVGQAGELAIANDFDDDVKQGKGELKKDPAAQRLQEEVVDGEDGEAGEGDGQNNSEGVDEHGDIQNAENNQGINEDDQDINNSGIDEVDDANNLDEQSQEIINEHQAEEDVEDQGGENDVPHQEDASSSDMEQNQLEEPSGNQ